MTASEQLYRNIRKLAFGKFPVPIFVLKEKSGYTVSLTSTDITFTGSVNLSIPLANCADIGEFTDLILPNFPLAYTGYYRQDESWSNLLKLNATLDAPLKILSRYYFSDSSLGSFISVYFSRILDSTIPAGDFNVVIPLLAERTQRHLTLFVACMLVDYRRLGEYANLTFTQNFYTDGTGADIGSLGQGDYDSISVQIGSVFSLQDDQNQPVQSSSDGWDKAGSEEFFNDRNSFWYRLFCWLRDRLEQEFGDYSFRKDSGVWGKLRLDKPVNYQAYFDSYPFTLSPYSRGIQ